MEWINTLLQHRIIRAIDAEFGRFIQTQLANDSSAQTTLNGIVLLAVLLSRETGKKHVCVPLHMINLDNPLDIGHKLQSQWRESGIELPTLNWISPIFQATTHSGLVKALETLGLSRIIAVPSGNDQPVKPMIFQHGRLYLRRYWLYEVELATSILSRQNQYPLPSTLTDHLYQLFEISTAKIDWQKMACLVALTRQFAVITGGPGTGKTTTVTRLLALIISFAALNKTLANRKPVIRLVAPTGKAAARLSESIKGAKHRLPVDDTIKRDIPEDAATIHRLLGVVPGQAGFKFNEQNKLHLDILVVDEASMVDLPLMTRLMQALPAQARVILLGDKDQLASVEAGSVLADICEAEFRLDGPQQIFWSSTFFADIRERLDEREVLPELADNRHNWLLAESLVSLKESHRFSAGGGIGRLAQAINFNRGEQLDELAQSADAETEFVFENRLNRLINHAVDGYRPYLDAIRNRQSPEQVINLFNKYRVLCAIRQSDFGVAGVNRLIVERLKKAGLISVQSAGQDSWHHFSGQPVMVTENDYNLKLFNGDIGLILPDPESPDRKLKAWFINPDGTIRSLFPARLPGHETVFAMTIHKSQGSEFERVAMLLPGVEYVGQQSIMTRELIYTGVTRAKSHITMFTDIDVLKRAINVRTWRASGLATRLYPSIES